MRKCFKCGKDLSSGVIVCGACAGLPKPEPSNELERIRAMDIKEFCEWLVHFQDRPELFCNEKCPHLEDDGFGCKANLPEACAGQLELILLGPVGASMEKKHEN